MELICLDCVRVNRDVCSTSARRAKTTSPARHPDFFESQAVLGRRERGRMPGAPPAAAAATALRGSSLDFEATGASGEEAGAAAEESGLMVAPGSGFSRSEERRVGKECRSRWSPYH